MLHTIEVPEDVSTDSLFLGDSEKPMVMDFGEEGQSYYSHCFYPKGIIYSDTYRKEMLGKEKQF